jgi:multiple sugar transport system permease protein
MKISRKTKHYVENTLCYIALFLVLIFTIFPIVWMLLTSIKDEADILTLPPRIFFNPTLKNYNFVFERSKFFRGLMNSLIVVFSVIAITLPIAMLAAYSFARFNVGGGQIQFYILTVRMFPPIAAIVPFFIIFRDIGLLDNILALIILNTIFNSPFTVWLLYGFFKEIPQDLEEAAMTEGSSRFEAFREIIIPLIAPALTVAAIFTALFTWNEFLFAFLTTRTEAITVTRVMAGFYTERGILWGPLSACATLCIVPMFIFVLLIQKYIVRGLTFGAVR